MSRHRRPHSRTSRLTIRAAAGSVAAASVAAAAIAASQAIPATAAGASELGSVGRTADLALAAGRAVNLHAGQHPASASPDHGRAGSASTVIAAGQPMNLRYALAQLAARRNAAAECATLLSARRAAAARAGLEAAGQSGPAAAGGPVASGTPQQIAMAMLPSFGWSAGEFGCLNALWSRESGWNPYASNPSSGAYGIPQALPGSKMAAAGPDWQTSAATQIRWGLGYIRATYGSPCGAWGHEQGSGWY